jgi:hypothetical protein
MQTKVAARNRSVRLPVTVEIGALYGRCRPIPATAGMAVACDSPPTFYSH